MSSSSFVNLLSTLLLQSHHAWNFSTIHAASPAGESFSAYPTVSGFVA